LFQRPIFQFFSVLEPQSLPLIQTSKPVCTMPRWNCPLRDSSGIAWERIQKGSSCDIGWEYTVANSAIGSFVGELWVPVRRWRQSTLLDALAGEIGYSHSCPNWRDDDSSIMNLYGEPAKMPRRRTTRG
jgi:hypothetical protein